jgi:hypothetical protein
MDWKEVAGKVMDTAPIIGSLLGGPIGGAAGGLISMIGSAFGLKPSETTPEKINAIIQQDPQALLKFKELEMNNQLELQKLALQSDQIYLLDRQNARQRQVESEKATGRRDYNLYILAWVTVIGFYGLISLLIWKPMTEAATSPAVYMLFGALSAGFGSVMQYFFGSSKGSADKTQLMASAGKK